VTTCTFYEARLASTHCHGIWLLVLPHPQAQARAHLVRRHGLGGGLLGLLTAAHLPLLPRQVVGLALLPAPDHGGEPVERHRVQQALSLGLPHGDGLGLELADGHAVGAGGGVQLDPLLLGLPLAVQRAEDAGVGGGELDHEAGGLVAIADDRVAVQAALPALQLLEHPVAGLREGEAPHPLVVVPLDPDDLVQVPDLHALALQGRLHVGEPGDARLGLEDPLTAPAGADQGETVRGLDPAEPVGAGGAGGRDSGRVVGASRAPAAGRDALGLRLGGLDLGLELAGLVDEPVHAVVGGVLTQLDAGLDAGVERGDELTLEHGDLGGVEAVLADQLVAGEREHELVRLDDGLDGLGRVDGLAVDGDVEVGRLLPAVVVLGLLEVGLQLHGGAVELELAVLVVEVDPVLVVLVAGVHLALARPRARHHGDEALGDGLGGGEVRAVVVQPGPLLDHLVRGPQTHVLQRHVVQVRRVGVSDGGEAVLVGVQGAGAFGGDLQHVSQSSRRLATSVQCAHPLVSRGWGEGFRLLSLAEVRGRGCDVLVSRKTLHSRLRDDSQSAVQHLRPAEGLKHG